MSAFPPVTPVTTPEELTVAIPVVALLQTPEGVVRLASPTDDEEFARVLYSALREADVQGLAEVVVMQPIGIGIAVAIRDRLKRAAHGNTHS
jgi:L-threonylcarbamoyladenylate synthase